LTKKLEIRLSVVIIEAYQSGLKQRDILSPFLSNVAFEYAIRRGLKLNGTHHLLAYADDVNIVEENIDPIQKNTNALLDASKEISLEVNPEKTKYILMSLCKKAGQKHSIKIMTRFFEGVANFIYSETCL
jgi:hypothetical protein